MIIVQRACHLGLIDSIRWTLQSMSGIAYDSVAWQELLGEEMEGTLCYSTAFRKQVIYLSFKREADEDVIAFKLLGMTSPTAQKMYSLLQQVHRSLAANNAEEAYNLIDYELYVKPDSNK